MTALGFANMPDDYAACAEIYDLIPLYKSRRDVPFYVNLARESGGPVLELGCGTGRVSLPVARAGVAIVGMDASEAMLDVFRRKLLAEPPEVRGRTRIVCRSMSCLDLGERFPLITTPFRSFQHLLTIADQKECLTRVREHLAPDGRFVLDVFSPNFELMSSQRVGDAVDDADFTDPATGERIIRSWQYLALRRESQTNVVEFTYRRIRRDGTERRTSHAVPIRYFFRYELEHLLDTCGLRIDEILSDYDRSPYDARKETIMLCRRK